MVNERSPSNTCRGSLVACWRVVATKISCVAAMSEAGAETVVLLSRSCVFWPAQPARASANATTKLFKRKLKRRRVRTVHFVSPSVWAWRRERLQLMGRAVDRMLALFPFEPPLYEAVGIPVTYVGHPLAQEARAAGTRRAAREILKQSVAAPLFALLPGSRLSEIASRKACISRW